jgi:hypothetical protein
MSQRWTRRGVVALLAAIAGRSSSLRAQVNSRGPATQDSVTPQDIDLRLERRAAEIKRMAPQGADRYVLFDLSFPVDAAEYRAVGKTALVLIVAVSRKTDELPLRRVYARAGTNEVDAQRLGSRRSELPPKSLARAVVGRYREDAFYLAPVGALLRENMLIGDFAKNRLGFVINRAAFDPPDFILADGERDVAGKTDATALNAFVEREYPGFGLLDR